MDVKDRKLLLALDGNSRQSFVQLGKRAGVSPETARYRVNRLAEKGAIARFLTLINTHLFGYSYHEIFIKLKKVDEQKRQEIIEWLCKSPKITWIGNFDGNYDLGMITLTKSQAELGILLTDFQTTFGSTIMRKVISINLRGEYLSRDYLIKKQRTYTEQKQYDLAPRKIALDEQDVAICRALAENARIPAVDIAQSLDVAPDTVIARMQRLKRMDVIAGHTIVLDNSAMGQLHFKILLYLNDASPDVVRRLLEFCRMNNRVIAIIQTLAEWDYEFDLEVESLEQFKKFTMDLTNMFADSIKDYEVVRILSMPKYNFFP